MSSITISDLHSSKNLERNAMCAVRGGFAFSPDLHVNLNVNQKVTQVQDIGVSVLNNNGVIGTGFVGPTINLDVVQKATNNAFLPKFV